MSLLSSIRLANNTLQAAQIGLQVVGQNIANANTPSYIREEVVLVPAGTQRLGDIVLGMGVRVDGVVQIVDRFLEERLRVAISDRASSEAQEKSYQQIEAILNELSDNDISSSMNRFFSSIHEVANQPESRSVRNLAVLNGEILANDIVRMAKRTLQFRLDLDEEVTNIANDIDRLLEEIRQLNIRIAQTEGGGTSRSDAVGLRDARQSALASLAELIDIRVEEQLSGGVAVYAGSTFLVIEGVRRSVDVVEASDDGIVINNIVVRETDSLIESGSGKLAGMLTARDEIVGGFLKQLNEFAGTLAVEFNRIFANGQGQSGFQELISEFNVNSAQTSLDTAGLLNPPQTGTFEVKVRDRQTGLTRTDVVDVNVNGLETDTTLDSLAAALDAIDGVAASVSTSRQLEISTESAEKEFAFAHDTSGVLAALGLNTFFSGTSASDLSIRDYLKNDPGKFAASQGGINQDSENALELASFLDKPLATAGNATIGNLYDDLAAGVTQGAAVARAVTDGFRSFEETLQAQSLATSGVNLDEEAVRLMMFQRMYQASARFIAALGELLEQLTNI